MTRRDRDPRRGQRSYSSSRRRRDEEDDDDEGLNWDWGTIFLGLIALAVIVACGIGAIALGPRILAALDRALPPASTQQPGGPRPTSTPQPRQPVDQGGQTQSDATPAPEGAAPATPAATIEPTATPRPLPDPQALRSSAKSSYAEVDYDHEFELTQEVYDIWGWKPDWYYNKTAVMRIKGTVLVGFNRNQIYFNTNEDNPNKLEVVIRGQAEPHAVSLQPPQPGDFRFKEGGWMAGGIDENSFVQRINTESMGALQRMAYEDYLHRSCSDDVYEEAKRNFIDEWTRLLQSPAFGGWETVEFTFPEGGINCVDPFYTGNTTR